MSLNLLGDHEQHSRRWFRYSRKATRRTDEYLSPPLGVVVVGLVLMTVGLFGSELTVFPNFPRGLWDVLSNVGFAILAILGCWVLFLARHQLGLIFVTIVVLTTISGGVYEGFAIQNPMMSAAVVAGLLAALTLGSRILILIKTLALVPLFGLPILLILIGTNSIPISSAVLGEYSLLSASYFGFWGGMGLFASIALHRRGVINPILFLASALSSVIMMLLQGSATSILAAVLGLLSLLVLKQDPSTSSSNRTHSKSRRTQVFVYMAVAAIVIPVIVFISPALRGLIGGLFGKDPSWSGRFDLWANVLQDPSRIPIMGLGVDSDIVFLNGTYLSSHNTLLGIFLAGGIVSVTLFALLLARSAYLMLSVSPCLAPLLIFLVSASFTSSFWVPLSPPGISLWAIIFMPYACVKVKRAKILV